MQILFLFIKVHIPGTFPLQLWLERARRNKDVLHDAPPVKVQPKRPHKIEVCYPFSSDRALQEQVTLDSAVQGIRQLKAPFLS